MLIEVATSSTVATVECDASASFAILGFENGFHEFHYLKGPGIVVRVTSATHCRFSTLKKRVRSLEGTNDVLEHTIIVAMSPTKVGNGLYIRSWECLAPYSVGNIAFRPLVVRCHYQPLAFPEIGDAGECSGSSPPGGSPKSSFTHYADLLPSAVIPHATGGELFVSGGCNVMAWTAVGSKYMVLVTMALKHKAGQGGPMGGGKCLNVSVRAKVELYQECCAVLVTAEYLVVAEREGVRYWLMQQLLSAAGASPRQADESQDGSVDRGMLKEAVDGCWVPLSRTNGEAHASTQSKAHQGSTRNTAPDSTRPGGHTSGGHIRRGMQLQPAGGRKVLLADQSDGALWLLQLPQPHHGAPAVPSSTVLRPIVTQSLTLLPSCAVLAGGQDDEDDGVRLALKTGPKCLLIGRLSESVGDASGPEGGAAESRALRVVVEKHVVCEGSIWSVYTWGAGWVALLSDKTMVLQSC